MSKYFDVENSIDDYNEVPWALIKSYFAGHHLKQLVKHQLESFNHFTSCEIQNTINMFNPVHICSEQDFNRELKKYRLEIYINFENFNIYRPQIHENNGATKLMFPQQARIRNFTYSSNMTIDINIKYIIRTGEELENTQTLHKILKNINFGKLPIMLKSNICVLTQYKHLDSHVTGECKMDPGGYFIINGSEKTVLAQERAAENQIYCFDIAKNNTKYSWIAEIKSVPDWKCISPKQSSIMISNKNNGFGYSIYLQIPRLKNPVPIFIIFRAFNIITDKDICEKIIFNIENEEIANILQFLRASIVEANTILNYEDAIKHITNNVTYTPLNMDKESGAKKKRDFAIEVINNDIFPHCKTEIQKIYFLGYAINKLIRSSMGLLKQDDRDSYLNKRIDLTGTLLNNLLRNYFNKLVKDLQKQIIREINNGSWKSNQDYESIINSTNIYKIIKPTTIENGIKRALATGDFGIKQINSNKVGVAQVLNRLTYISSLSHLRRINTPIDKSGKLVPPRRLHSTTWGYICPAETPEGASIGIVKNLSYMTHLTIPSNSEPLYDIITPLVIELHDASKNNLQNNVKVFINGSWIGITIDPENLYKKLKLMKYNGIINIYTSVTFLYSDKEIKICNDAGRMCRPLLRVENNKLLLTKSILDNLISKKITWNDLLINNTHNNSVIEYIDSYEQNANLICMYPEKLSVSDKYIYKYTHCEIHPSTIFGILASCIPFPQHNQSPRNTYQCLDINTLVLMKDQSYKYIKDIKVGDEVQTFDSITMKTSFTKIINQYVRETTKQMFNVKTYSGKSFNATFDHKFMTYHGWIEVKDLDLNNDLLGIKPVQIEMSKICEKKIILNEIAFRDTLNDYVNINNINKYINKLEKLNLLPLYSDDKRIPILARIFGYTLADGTLTYHKRDKTFMLQADFGNEYGSELFENDIEMIGFKRTKLCEGTREFNSSIHHTWTIHHQGIIGCLFKCMGMIHGKKTTQKSNDVPDWIKNGSDLVKREFLSGIQGGDGCQIRYNKLENKGYNYICGTLGMSKNEEFKESLLTMMTTISDMFNYFNINNKIISRKNEKDDDRYFIGVQLKNSQDNLIKYFDTIGYRYDIRKITNSAIVVEYLKYKNLLKEEYILKVQQVRDLYDKNYSNKNISNMTNISIDKITSIIRSYKNNREITCPNLNENNVDNFVKKCKIINDAIFVPIYSKEEINMTMISDITTESETHSFIIKGGIMTHNSAMGKQAMGVYVTNFDNRMDKTAYVLSYPMRPLVDTRIMNLLNLNEIPSGEQVIVAIGTHSGYNQEDSILFNKGAIDRGLFQATIYHTEKDEDKKISGDNEIRTKPDKSNTKCIKFANYDKINKDGVINENTLVSDRDIIISKIIPIKENKNDHTKVIKYEDDSRIYRTNEETYVDKNCLDRNGDGYKFCKVKLRNVRKPVIGDKFCYTPDHEVLTDKGWINITLLTSSHKIASLVNKSELVYVYPTNIVNFDCNEELVSIENENISLIVTKNHRMWVGNNKGKNFTIVNAEDCYKKECSYRKSCSNYYIDYNKIMLPKELILNKNKDFIEYFKLDNLKFEINDWIVLYSIIINRYFGFILNHQTNDNNNYICLKFTSHNHLEELENLQYLLNKYNIIYTAILYTNFRNIKIFNSTIINYFKNYNIRSDYFKLHDWIFYLNTYQSKHLLDSLFYEKIKQSSTFNIKADTSSKLFADNIQILSLHSGYYCNIKSNLELDYNNYTLYINTKFSNTNFQHFVINKSHENMIYYNSKVYCCTVPNDGIIYVRHNDKACWCGNSSRHGQKGTIGNIIPEEDMPFTADGLKPDIIINPHAIPSRMTIAQLKETLLGKVLLQLGLFGDGTSFGKLTIDDICEELQKHGYESKGNEILYNGLTGEQLSSNIFIGPAFYQRLKHMVNDKQHSRSIGPMVNLTRQPAEGRSRDGGLRFGEMERDGMIAHGASRFTKGRIYDASDSFRVHVCNKCGLLVPYNDKQNIHICKTCNNKTDFKYVEIPYACKLMFQELMTMNIAPRIVTE